jgi:hypothetical protein
MKLEIRPRILILKVNPLLKRGDVLLFFPTGTTVDDLHKKQQLKNLKITLL